MNQTMTYKGYTAHIQYSDVDEALIGRIIDINDIIGFEGQSIPEVTEAFHEMIDGYLADCAEEGREPNKPFSGKLMTRMPPEVHRRMYIAAKRVDVSLNSWLLDAVIKKLEKDEDREQVT